MTPRMGLMIAIPLFTLNPSGFKMVQSMCGVQVWRAGGSEKVNRHPMEGTLFLIVKLCL